MRRATQEECKQIVLKLHKFVGPKCEELIAGDKCLRVFKNRVFLSDFKKSDQAAIIGKTKLVSYGKKLGKLSKTGRFRLSITALPILAPLAATKCILRPKCEQPFLYGSNILVRQIQNIPHELKQNQGVIVYSSTGLPVGLGVVTSNGLSTNLDAIGVYRYCDIGEYLRGEEKLI